MNYDRLLQHEIELLTKEGCGTIWDLGSRFTWEATGSGDRHFTLKKEMVEFQLRKL